LIATGQVITGVILVVLGGLVATIDNVLRPAILSDRAQMNGLLMFISLLGGVSVFGFLGIVLGPLVSAIVTALFEAYTAPGELISGSATPTEDRNGQRVTS
jgi:predicted PurR-regulated permease PerM